MTEYIHRLAGTTSDKHFYTEEAYCGFMWTVIYEEGRVYGPSPFTHHTLVSTCPDCEEAYAMHLLSELP